MGSSLKVGNRLLPTTAILSLPIASVFLVLAAMGLLAPLPAILGTGASIALTSLLLRPYWADIATISLYARDLSRGENVAIPNLRTAIAEDHLAAISLMRRAWHHREDETNTLIGFHETLFDSLPTPLFLLTTQRRIARANQAARAIFGANLQGRDMAAVLRNPAFLEATDQLLSGGPRNEVDFSVPLPIERDFRAILEPLPQIGVDGAKAILFLHDVTTLKRMEQMRADFVANASHELRTPLAAVLGFIETLRGPAKDDTEAHERFLGIMFDQASRMSRLVADLLNLSRIELNEHTPPSGHSDISNLIRRVAEGLELTAQERGMEIQLSLVDSLPSVRGQDDELGQIFQNLIDNALKYGREGTNVEVIAKIVENTPSTLPDHQKRALAVSVRDHGEGIAREHLPRLTERFFRVDTARSRRLGGTGLGLAIVKHVVNRHRGLLSIESTLGEGSVFTVYLPLADENLGNGKEGNETTKKAGGIK